LGTKERREREREELRTKILDAARELFASEGYEAVTMRKIAERIEYSPTAIYLHFKDKEAVLREICDADFGALAHGFSAIARIPDPRERLMATGNAYAEFGLSHPNHYRLMFMTPHPPLSPEDSAIERGNPEQDAYAFLRGTLAEALAGGRLRPGLDDLDLLTQTVWAAVHGVVSLEIAKGNDGWVDWRPAAERVRLMIDFITRCLWREDADGGSRGAER
jgi:AcrR family transcriptional regulator